LSRRWKGYASHERTTFEDLARLRSQSQGSQASPSGRQTEQAITAAIGKIMAVARSLSAIAGK
jgi:hypothetical protein